MRYIFRSKKLGLKDKILDEYGRIRAGANELRDVVKFLNRILVLEVRVQNDVFNGYFNKLQEATEAAIANGTLDRGLENYKADHVIVNESKVVKEDKKTKAATTYYSLTAKHKIKPTKFSDLDTHLPGFQGFFKNKNTGAVRAVWKSGSRTDVSGAVSDNFRLVGADKKQYIPEQRLRTGWDKISTEEAKTAWDKEVAELPEFREEKLHLLKGNLLSVWDKLPSQGVRVYRVLTDDGEMLVGRIIPESDIDGTLLRLGAERTKPKISVKDIISNIKSGNTIVLDNDWKLMQRRVSGEQRIELTGPNYLNTEALQKKGIFTERISYQTRYFVPVNTNTEKIINDLLEISPVLRVENEKYSMTESEDFLNGQTRSGILSGNSGREFNASTRKQIKRVSNYKRKLEGKTSAERKETAKELVEKGYTEEIINGNHKYTLIKDDGYNDDMRSIISEAKAYGKEVGFFVGNAIKKFDRQRNFKIDGIKLSDNKILIRYDGAYSPQSLLMHELVHTEWNNPEMQKAKDVILSDLSESEKEKILQIGRYKDYMTLYHGDTDAVWEEFIADVFADINNYADDYIDTAVDYWYNDKVIDRYNPSEYIKAIDAGGNEAALDNIGFGNEYSLSGNSFDIPYNEKRQLDDYVLRKNHSSNKLEKVDCKEIGNNFYIWENNSKTDYTVISMTEIDGNEDLIAERRKELKNGNLGIGKKHNVSYEGRSGNGRRSDNSLATVYQRRKSANGNGGISSEPSTDNTFGRSKESSGNKQTKYALNSYETDAESLTPERKKAIFEQYNKDRAGIEKPTIRQVWGERAEWVAHNATRVFPNIPERGEKGTFFAEFRKSMIQWKNLPTTASFMVQDKLNKMTEGLTPDEFKTFSELVYFLDLQEEAQIQKESGYDEILLPNEITPKEVDEIVNVLNDKATDNVQQALAKRQNIWKALKSQYIDLNRYIGFDTDGKFKRKNYYHHQVIDYMNKSSSGTGNREIGIKAGRGWLKKRQGSTKAINTDFLAVEYKSMLQMQYDVYIAETLGKIKQKYDIKPQLEKEAFRQNKKALNDIIQKECTDKDGNIMLDSKSKPDSETYRKQKWYNARIMWGFSGLFDLAERGELTDYNGEYTKVVKALKNHDLNINGLYKYVGIIANTDLPDNATAAQEQAVQSARTILKYTAQKNRWIKELLADDYQTWETIAKSMSDTHTIHQPRRGNYFYTKTVLDEDAFNKAHEDMVLSLVSGEVDLNNVDVAKLFEQYSDTVKLTGAAYEQWVLPKEIVTTMDEIANPKQVSEGAKVARAIVSAWKGWATSVNPLRTVKFGLRNLAGDLDAVIAGNLKVTFYSKRAVQEIYQAMRHKNYSNDFMEWIRRGGYTSMLFANEMDTEMQDKLFSHLKDKQGINIFRIPTKLFEGYYNGIENVQNFREAILRYSAYLYFKNEIIKNGGNVKDYVASNRYIVRGLDSVEDKAYQLSKDLLGAYDEVGKLGQTLRRYWIPFYSFTETNMKRYYRMFENIIMSDDEIPKKAGKLLLKALMANMMMLLMIAWNKFVRKEQDDKLPPSIRDIPHITFGQIGDNVYAFRQLGSFSELLEWIGLDDYKWTKEDLTAPVDKAWGMITPFIKMPVELASGLNFYPSLTQPRAIRDKWQHFFNSLGVDSLYNELTGKPTRGAGEILKGAFVYNYDYKESAYYEILDIKRKWQDNDSGSIYKPTPKSNALYYMKTAVRYKDKKAALKYLDKYFENGGTGKGIKQSFATLNPMYGFTAKNTAGKGSEFIASLSNEEKEKLKVAQDFYENDLMLPPEVLSRLGKKDITDEEAKNLLRNYINAKCK